MLDLTCATRRAANSLIMLVLRGVWLERNSRVFDNKATTAARVLSSLLDEWNLWVACRRGPLRDID